jgi:hypothetical protein
MEVVMKLIALQVVGPFVKQRQEGRLHDATQIRQRIGRSSRPGFRRRSLCTTACGHPRARRFRCLDASERTVLSIP